MADYFAIDNVLTGTLLIIIAQGLIFAVLLIYLDVGRYTWVCPRTSRP